jgi:hypothetical protein
MELANRWQDRNLPKLESVIAWIVILIIMAVFLRYILVIFARAEMSSVNSTVLNINSAIQYHAAMAVLKGDYQTLLKLKTINPFSEIKDIREEYIENQISDTMNIFPDSLPFLVRRSAYLGEFTNPDLNSFKSGSWFFDNGENSLIYLVRNDLFFNTALPGNPRIRFKINIEYEEQNANLVFDPGIDKFLNIKLQNIDEYNWTF